MTEWSVETCSPIISSNECCADVNNWLIVCLSTSWCLYTKIQTKSVLHFVGHFFLPFGAIAPPPVGQGLLIHMVSRSHTTTHHSRYDSSGRGISSSQRPLLDDTQHLCETVFRTTVTVPLGSANFAQFVEWLWAWWSVKEECITQLRCARHGWPWMQSAPQTCPCLRWIWAIVLTYFNELFELRVNQLHPLTSTYAILQCVCMLVTCGLTNSTEQRHFWKDNRFSASPEISQVLWKLKVLRRTATCSYPRPAPAYALPSQFLNIHFIV